MKPLKRLQSGRLNFNIFMTSFGWSCILWSNRGISRLFLPCREKDSLLTCIKKEFDYSLFSKSLAPGQIIRDIKGYFDGGKPLLDYALDFTGCTPFQVMVYNRTKTIPYGQIKTYLWISRRIKNNNSQRAVGGALAKNPLPIFIPCHRVIKSNGDIGGFSAGTGVHLKEKMLLLERGCYG